MPIGAPVKLTSGSLIATQSSFTTASISPTANRLILVAVAVRSAVNVDSITGAGLTFVKIGEAGSGGSLARRVALFRALGPSPSSGALTITTSAATTSCGWSVFEVDGIDTSGTNGSGAVRQPTVVNQAGTPPTVSLAAFADTANRPFAVLTCRSDTDADTAAGWTSLHDVSFDIMHFAAQWKDAVDTSVEWSQPVADNSWASIAVELVAAPGAQSQAATLDSVVQAQGQLATSTVAGAIKAARQATLTLEGAVRAARVAVADNDAAIIAPVTAAAALQSAVRAAVQAGLSLEAATRATRIATATLDASILDAGATEVQADLTTAVRAAMSLATALQAAVSVARDATATIDGLVEAEGLFAAASLSGAILAGRQLSLICDAAISQANSLLAALDTVVSAPRLGLVSADAAVRDTPLLSASLDVVIGQVGTPAARTIGVPARVATLGIGPDNRTITVRH